MLKASLMKAVRAQPDPLPGPGRSDPPGRKANCQPSPGILPAEGWRSPGSRAVVALLVERHRESVYRLALRMTRNASDADDAAQHTFLQAHRKNQLVPRWLGHPDVAASHRAELQPDAPSRRGSPSLRAAPGRAPPGSPLGRALVESSEGADELLDRKRLAQRVRDALAQLDEPQRAALVLRELEGLSSQDAAAALGVSPELVRQRAHRARLRLRKILAGSVAERVPG